MGPAFTKFENKNSTNLPRRMENIEKCRVNALGFASNEAGFMETADQSVLFFDLSKMNQARAESPELHIRSINAADIAISRHPSRRDPPVSWRLEAISNFGGPKIPRPTSLNEIEYLFEIIYGANASSSARDGAAG